ncbi:MAG: metal ABC transporter substrate-binding protein [bacterium]|nr:metal ABC transporter substrate-binding protein [bacterium]
MKKIISIVLLSCILLTGCIKRDDMEGINIITTIYPIEYVAKRLYGENSNISSIYPRSTNIYEYEITDKQLKDFSSYDLFIYNGESNERTYATSMLNINKNLKIIDASYGLDVINADSDIWLNPSNILMIAQNIKQELSEYIDSPYIKKEIENNYELLKVDISELENELKKTADNSKYKRIISYDESLLFLEKYGFEVINLTDKNKNKDNNIELAKSLLSQNKLTYVFVTENENESNLLTELKNNYSAKIETFKIMTTITENDISNNEDYLSIMKSNISKLKEETYK